MDSLGFIPVFLQARYEHTMKILFAVLLCLSTIVAIAGEPLRTIYIDNENAATHGFELTSSESNGYYEINWLGPQSVNGCYAEQSSFGVIKGPDKNDLGIGSTIRFKTNERPSGFFNQLDNDDLAILTISFRCSDAPSKGVMFILQATRGKLITNASR